MKVIVIGASHSGLTAAKELKTFSPTTEVVLFDRQSAHELAYVSSGIMMYYHGMIEELDQLTADLDPLIELGIQLHLETMIKNIDPYHQVVTYETAGKIKEESYDKLIVATGSNAYQNLSMNQHENVISYKTLSESKDALTKLNTAKKVAVIGSGYISVELVEALSKSGKEVYLIHSQPYLLARYYDAEFITPLEEQLKKSGIHYYPEEYFIDFQTEGQQVTKIELNEKALAVDLIILARTAHPNTNILANVVEQNDDQTIKVNRFLQTSDPNIYAIGDIVPLRYEKTNRDLFMPLVGRAVRMGRAVALNLAGISVSYPISQKITASELFGCFIGSCGVTENEAPFLGLSACSFQTKLAVDPTLIDKKNVRSATYRVIYLKQSLEVVGFQIFAQDKLIDQLDLAAILLTSNITLPELAIEEFCFMPRFTERFHPLNQLAAEALKEECKKRQLEKRE